VIRLVTVGYEQDRKSQEDEEQALEEIRRLFARYRRTARHGVVRERDEEPGQQGDDAEQADRAP
jgi:hypothetical protein